MLKKPILIICYNNLEKAPRFLMEVSALKEHYRLLAASKHGDVPSSNKYTYVDLAYPNIQFHINWPVFPRKIISFFIRILFRFRRKTGKDEQFILEHEFKILKQLDFDLIITHHLNTLPLAFKLAECKKVKVIFNAHEYYPKEFEDIPEWIENRQPEYISLCQKFLPRLSAIFVVGEKIGEEYKKEFGVNSVVITNSKKLQNLKPVVMQEGITRIIHHGVAIRSRGLEEMILMMGLLGDAYSLDLMLTSAKGSPYMEELLKLSYKFKNVNFIQTVPTSEISKKINTYDIGCFLLQPTNFNYLNALPNKFFEFIQARLAIAIGPSPEMANMVNKYDLGVVAKDFTPTSLSEEIRKLTPEKIMHYKNQCDKYAFELSSEKDESRVLQTVNSLLHV